MQNINITTHTREEIRDFFFKTRESLEQQSELQVFLELISPSLRYRVSTHLMFDELSRNIMLREIDEKKSKEI